MPLFQPICALFILLLSALPAQPALARDSVVASQSAAQRQITPLIAGWRFRFGDLPMAVTRHGYDDSDWQEVSVPHSWNRIGQYSLERDGSGNNDQGTGWYRLKIKAPPAAADQRQYLDFAAVGNIADVWINGQHAGTHKGAFSRFRLDVTQSWKAGQQNLIVVRADNSKPAVGSSTEHVIPLAGDFFIHGGIYRDVTLLQLNAASIDPLDYGGPGIYARAAEVSDSRAILDIRTRLRNFSDARNVSLTTQIRSADGEIVSTVTRDLTLENGWQDEAERLTIDNPRRWNGRADPYFYTFTATLADGSEILDRVTQPLGIRTFRFDADAGFFLNGEHLKLHGVSRHQDRLGQGWVLSREDHAEDMAMIAEIGANTVRHAHYQHADEWSDEADRAGMVVWAELPYVGAPSLTGGKGSPALWANAETQLRELIRQNYNHPSILMWSIGNEVDSAKAFGAVKEPPSPIELLQHLQQVAKTEDPSRATIFADFSEDLGPFGENRQPMTGVADLIGYNRYVGWYMLQNAQAGKILGGMIDKFHARHPEVPISISEYGAGGSITQHSDDPTSGYVASAGRPQPEEYESYVHELNWPAIESRDYIFASWVWNMFDFASDLRSEGDAVDINTKGLVTMDRKVKKDAFYYYQAAWSEAPMIHLTGKRYVDRSYPVMDVKAFTNAPNARLSFNGVDLGEAQCANYSCVWKGVALRPGSNEARVTAGAVSDTASWNGIDPLSEGIRIDAGNLAASKLGALRFGSDSFVTGGQPAARYSGSIGGRSEGPDVPVKSDTPALFDYWRAGDQFSYAFPVPDGEWTVTIYSVEPGKREVSVEAAAMMGTSGAAYKPVVMTVLANGTPAIENLDVASAAGGKLIGIDRSFPVTVSGGELKLDFQGAGGTALVAAIEIAPR